MPTPDKPVTPPATPPVTPPATPQTPSKNWGRIATVVFQLIALTAISIFFGILLWNGLDADLASRNNESETLTVESEWVRDSSNNLVQPTQWAIGTVLTLGVLLVGYSWFSSSRSREEYKNDLEREARLVRHELELEATKSIKNVEKSSNIKIAALEETTRSLRSTLENARTAIVQEVTAHFNDQTKSLREDVELKLQILES